MITDEIFQNLRTLDQNLTENQFTTRYLKTSRSYLCNRRNRQRDVSNDVLLSLYAELSGIGSTWQQMADTEDNDRTRDRWKQNAQAYTHMAEQVLHQIADRSRQQA